ncbi:hypothetical protein [Paenibacillus elgii]|uniref:hypothetical protein n=1 Tax=Paenibacillus elgii TaxID=189691 RepID=UPI00203E6510|nr:hypothetical protein [Paenibacillus elgii]MCM3272350.1 hypothetical protein [Paenibacillus elgii]
MNKKYEIRLQVEELEQIEQLLHSKSTSKGIRHRCLVLLLADEGQGAIPTQAEISRRAGISEATSEPPQGYARRTIRLLTRRVIELNILDSVGRETIRTTLKKTKLKTHLKKQWCIPAKSSSEFVARMEDILKTYALPYDPEFRSSAWMSSRPIVGSFASARTDEAREDYEYVRKGSCNLFMFTEPLAG